MHGGFLCSYVLCVVVFSLIAYLFDVIVHVVLFVVRVFVMALGMCLFFGVFVSFRLIGSFLWSFLLSFVRCFFLSFVIYFVCSRLPCIAVILSFFLSLCPLCLVLFFFPSTSVSAIADFQMNVCFMFWQLLCNH